MLLRLTFPSHSLDGLPRKTGRGFSSHPGHEASQATYVSDVLATTRIQLPLGRSLAGPQARWARFVQNGPCFCPLVGMQRQDSQPPLFPCPQVHSLANWNRDLICSRLSPVPSLVVTSRRPCRHGSALTPEFEACGWSKIQTQVHLSLSP